MIEGKIDAKNQLINGLFYRQNARKTGRFHWAVTLLLYYLSRNILAGDLWAFSGHFFSIGEEMFIEIDYATKRLAIKMIETSPNVVRSL